MIENILPGSPTKLRILKAIYDNPGINLTELIRKAKTSPNLVSRYVNRLVEHGIVREERFGGEKKTHLRRLMVNLEDDLAVSVLSFIEADKKNRLLKKYRSIRPFITQLEEVFQDKDVFCLIYGSFARFAADSESDLDLLVVGEVNTSLKNRLREIFSTLDREYSIKVESLKQFLGAGDPLHQNLIEQHVVVYNEIGYLKAVGRIK